MSRRIAFLFPGQGAQAAGMGKDFFLTHAVAREVFEEGDDLLQENISKIIFTGPEELLKQTRYAQTAIFITSLAILKALRRQFPQIEPLLCAGLSLGEYSALTAAGWASFSQILPLVHYRAELMHAACEKHRGAMAALFGLSGAEVKKMVEELNLPNDLWVANYNSAEQTVISGTVKGVEKGIESAKARGKRAIPLKVHGAFHSGLMKEAQEGLQEKIARFPFNERGTPLIMNVCGRKVENTKEIVGFLQQQISSSVLWEQSIQSMENIDLFLEIGPGKVLGGLNKAIGVLAPTISVNKVEDFDAVEKFYMWEKL